MKRIAVLLSLVLLVIGRVAATSAQISPGTPAAASEAVSVISVEVDAPTPATFGFIQTTLAPGGSYSLTAGSAPAVRFVQKGTLSVRGDGLAIVPASSATPGPSATGDGIFRAGTAFVVPAGGLAQLRNQGTDPVTVFDFLTAADAAAANETDVTHLVLAQRTYELPAGAVTITLSQTTLDPGGQFAWPAEPATTMLYPLDRSDAFLLTGQGFNRGSNTIDIYALTITPA